MCASDLSLHLLAERGRSECVRGSAVRGVADPLEEKKKMIQWKRLASRQPTTPMY